MSLTNLGGPRARKLIKVAISSGAQSDSWYVWAYDPSDDSYDWRLQNGAGFEFAGHASGTIFVPSGWTTADITLTVCDTVDGTYVGYKLDGTNDYLNATTGARTVIVQAAASDAYEIPERWFGAGPFCKIHSMTADQAGDQSQTSKELIMWLVA